MTTITLASGRIVALTDIPLGLVPDKSVAKSLGVTLQLARKTRVALNIPAYTNGNPGNRGFPGTPGSFKPLLDAWGFGRAKAWVERNMPKCIDYLVAEADGRAPNRLQRCREGHERLKDAPLGLVPDNVIAVAYGYTRGFVSLVRRSFNINPFSVAGDSMFPNRRDSFSRLIAGLGVDGARAWLAQYQPKLVVVFDRRLNEPAKTATETNRKPSGRGLPIPSTLPLGSLLPDRSEEGKARARAATTGTSEQRDAALQRRPFICAKFFDETSNEKIAERERIERELAAFQARGGKVKRLVGTGNGGLGRLIECEEAGGMDCD